MYTLSRTTAELSRVCRHRFVADDVAVDIGVAAHGETVRSTVVFRHHDLLKRYRWWGQLTVYIDVAVVEGVDLWRR